MFVRVLIRIPGPPERKTKSPTEKKTKDWVGQIRILDTVKRTVRRTDDIFIHTFKGGTNRDPLSFDISSGHGGVSNNL